MDTTKLKKVQEILLKNLEELTAKHSTDAVSKKDLEYSKVLISNSNKLINTAKLEIEYIKVKEKLQLKLDFFE